ncbi:MAG: S8 family serine peptidase [Planctomycetota bacterium]
MRPSVFSMISCGALLLTLSTLPVAYAGQGDEAPWNYIALKACGVDRFLQDHPTWDGRGVTVFVLDNGADVDVPGLQTTSEGTPKFTDARDFTGEGAVEFKPVKMQENGVVESEDKEIRLTGVNQLALKAKDGNYYLGVLTEDQFKNSEFARRAGSMDINDNGQTGDAFGMLVFPVDGADYWVICLDTDLDHDISDEIPLRNFCDDPKGKVYFSKNFPDQQKRNFVIVAQIRPDEKKVEFHYADGSHSTHVSGIVAGYRIDGQDGFNGVAPGAHLVSCKIGDCTLAGGASVRESMKKAYEHAKDFHVKNRIPVVINMSYGIGSELEGSTDIDQYIDDLLLKNPGMILCTSAGNEGPGISTVGTPAASYMAISVGAVLADEVARNVYNASLGSDRVLHFSSRGGELDKPDIVAPGACLSTVPRWNLGSKMWGTSMASPYAAGVTALLVSAALQEFPDVEVTSCMIRRALQNSARSLDYCNDLDQGRGMIDLPAAWEILKGYLQAEKTDPDPVLAYDIETFCPEGAKGKARAAYWRSVYHPGAEDIQTFKVKALFKPNTPAETINGFFRKYTLRNETPFIKLIPESVPLRNESQADVKFSFNPEHLKTPGIHVGRIAAYEGEAKPANRAFDLLSTVIVPYTFGPDNNYAMEIEYKTVDPLEVHHYYLAVPPGASSMKIDVEAVKDEFALARVELFDPEGRSHVTLRGVDTKKDVLKAGTLVEGEDLVPGVWELTVYTDYTAGTKSSYKASVAFLGIQALKTPLLSMDYKPGTTPKGSIQVMNRFNKAVWASATGKVWGYSKTQEVKMEDKDTYVYSFSLDPTLRGVRFKINMSPEHYGLFTDFAINIKDSNGTSLVQDGLSYKFTQVDFLNPGDKGDYTLEMVAGYTHAEKAPFDFELIEEYVYSQPVGMKVSSPGADAFIPLIPDIPAKVAYTMEGVPPVAPKGYATSASISFTERGSEEEFYKIQLLAE